jgi:hypothetical protein
MERVLQNMSDLSGCLYSRGAIAVFHLTFMLTVHGNAFDVWLLINLSTILLKNHQEAWGSTIVK